MYNLQFKNGLLYAEASITVHCLRIVIEFVIAFIEKRSEILC